MKHQENGKHREAFEVWYSADRDFEKTREVLKVSHQTVRNWADLYGWTERADKRDLLADKKAEREAVERKAKMIEDQRKAGQALRTIGTRFLVNHQHTAVKNLKDAISAIEKGFALERQAEGLPDWVGQILNATDDELQDRYAELLRVTQGNSRD